MKYLVVNADDLGFSEGVNRGIVECHVRGIVTSASLMVGRPAAREAALLAREQHELAIGLHWDDRGVDLEDDRAVRAGFERQLDAFQSLLGRLPTHVDSHHHAHRANGVLPLFRELVAPLGVPLRGDGPVRYVGGFYAQWEPGVTELRYVGVDFLQQLLRDEVGDGWTELSCHPGYVAPDESSYAAERKAEIRTLTDRRVRQTIDELGIRLASHREYARSGIR